MWVRRLADWLQEIPMEGRVGERSTRATEHRLDSTTRIPLFDGLCTQKSGSHTDTRTQTTKIQTQQQNICQMVVWEGQNTHKTLHRSSTELSSQGPPLKLPLPRAKLDSTPPSQGRVTVLSREPKLTAKRPFKHTQIPATVGAKFMHAQY